MKSLGLVGVVVWIALMAMISPTFRNARVEQIDGKNKYRYGYKFAILAFLPIILWAGLREGRGYVDTNAYIKMYQQIPGSFEGLRAYLHNNPDDPGYTVFQYIVKYIWGESYRPLLLSIAIIQGCAVVFLYRKYSESYLMSIFLFIASAEYFSWMFNGIRQFLAVSIIMYGFPFLVNRKYLKFWIVVAFASTFHMTAIIMIPISLVVYGRPWNYRTLITIMIGILAIMMTSQFTDFVDVATRNTQYEDSVGSWNEGGDDGTNPIRVLVYAMPTILAFIGRRKLEQEEDNVLDICINMSIISTVLWMISIVTSGIYMGRLPVYASIFNYILIPYELIILFKKTLVRDAMLILYLAYYYYQLHFIWGAI